MGLYALLFCLSICVAVRDFRMPLGFDRMRGLLRDCAVALAIVGAGLDAAAQAYGGVAKGNATPKLDAAYVAAMKMRKSHWPLEQVSKWCDEQRDLAYLASGARFDEKLTRDQVTEPIAKRFPIYVRRRPGRPT